MHDIVGFTSLFWKQNEEETEWRHGQENEKKKHLTLGHKDSVIGHIPNTVLNTVGTDG